MLREPDGRLAQLKASIDIGIAAYKTWRQKSLFEQFTDVVCGFILTGMMLVLLYLIMLGSEYGGNG